MAIQIFRQALVASAFLAFSAGIGLAQDNTTTTAPAEAPAAAPAKPGEPDPKLVVAKLNGVDITRQDIIDSAAGLRQDIRDNIDHFFPQLLDRYIFLKLVAEKGRADGLDKDPEVTKLVADSVKQIEDNAVREIFFKRLIDAKITDAQVDARYNELKAKFDEDAKKAPPQREIDASHILVKSEDEAKAVLEQLKGGADFATLAKEKSIDTSSGKNGGELGWFTQDVMVKEFGDAAFAMKKGEVSTTPVKSQFGYHIIKLNDERTKPLPTFDKQKDEIRLDLVEELRQEVAKGLKDNAKLEIIEPNGGTQPAQ
jgi:peptidyl-prolyl cis-trans isomerase C